MEMRELNQWRNDRGHPTFYRFYLFLTNGCCLQVLQACWGVFDSENALRQALADSLNDAANL